MAVIGKWREVTEIGDSSHASWLEAASLPFAIDSQAGAVRAWRAQAGDDGSVPIVGDQGGRG